MIAINFFIFSLVILASFFKTPINMCLTVVIINILLAITLYLTHRTWVFLTFSIIYIGAIIVIFAYFSAISPTLTDSSLTTKEKLVILLQLAPLTLLILLRNPNLTPQRKPENFIIHIYTYIGIILFILLFLTLYFAIVLVTKIIENIKSALRPWH